MKPRVLIVGTVPYNKKSTSRAFESYFCHWQKENLAQIFSNTKCPAKGHCGTLFQITDQRMIKRRFNRSLNTGIIYYDKDLPSEWSDNSLEIKSSFFTRLYKIGSKKIPLIYLLRKFVWKKGYWCTDKLNRWLDEFNPQCVFLSFSDDFFISEIALYVSERYKIPIVSSIGDDYYFNYKFSLSPFYHIYKIKYRKLIRKVLKHSGSAIYIGDKIRDKYNNEFGLIGKTVYLTSSIKRRKFRPINKEQPKISYFGNIRLGRNEALNDIGNALGKIDSSFLIHVYSNERDEKFYRIFANNPNVVFHGSIPYAQVQNKTLASDIVVVAEGFKKKDVDITKYSLSTKVADSLAAGVNILAYGSSECGAIEYAQNTGCIAVCTQHKNLKDVITKLILDISYQQKNYETAIYITNNNHSLCLSTKTFEDIINEAIRRGKYVK